MIIFFLCWFVVLVCCISLQSVKLLSVLSMRKTAEETLKNLLGDGKEMISVMKTEKGSSILVPKCFIFYLQHAPSWAHPAGVYFQPKFHFIG